MAEHESHKLMSITTLLAFTPWPAVSASILFILLVTALYLARGTAHQAISATANALAKGLRLASHSLAHAEQRLAAPNREVPLAAGLEAKERLVSPEFTRHGDTVRHDLARDSRGHPRLYHGH